MKFALQPFGSLLGDTASAFRSKTVIPNSWSPEERGGNMVLFQLTNVEHQGR